MLLRIVIVFSAWFSLWDTSVRADERLPAPLNDITCNFGDLAKHFSIAEAKLYGPDEYAVDGRIVAEETIVWTLEAKDALKGKVVYDLLHPNPTPGPFFRVRFFKTVDGKDVAADARPESYRLIRDTRWINPKTAPDLKRGDKLHVWVHLGKEGSEGLLGQKATRLVVTAK